MNLVAQSAKFMNESFTEDSLKTLGIVVKVLSGLALKASKADIETAMKTATDTGLALSDNDYAKAIMTVLSQAATFHGIEKEELLTDEAANVTAGIAVPSGPMSSKPLKKYKTFVVPSAVFNDYRSAIATDEYADVSEALNEGEIVVLQHKDTGARKGLRLKR